MSALADLVGVELGPTGWLEVTQQRIDAYARATGDPQWIHTDPARAAEGPFGTTIAHGFLTLALTTPLLDEVLPAEGGLMSLNYGMNRVRFPAPVPSGSRIRGRFRVASVEKTSRGERAVVEATVECDASEKPVCVAELVVLTVS
jgi:acyl dehydratase